MPTVYKSKYWGKAKHRSQIAVRGHVCWDSYAMRSAAWNDTLKCVGKKNPKWQIPRQLLGIFRYPINWKALDKIPLSGSKG